LPVRIVIGLLVAAGSALIARRTHSLTTSGALAATAVGGAAFVAGGKWIALLLFFFLSSALLSHWRGEIKRVRTAGVVEKGNERDAWQVLANGAVFACAAAGAAVAPGFGWEAFGVGAIASATADTWGTEIGSAHGMPRHVVTGQPVEPGTSGGITPAGTAGMLVGAASTAFLAWSVHWGTPVVAIITGGLAGAVLDSVLGATIQERRWCDQCRAATERRVHRCGSVTRPHGGVPGFGNDVVNLTSVLAGAILTKLLS
jgi:uncharacterized protein (TIGR00297 family)